MRYLEARGMVLLCGGLVGPIFLVVYFALGPMARPYINWMFWTGLFITGPWTSWSRWPPDQPGREVGGQHGTLTRQGILAMARPPVSPTPPGSSTTSR